MRERRRIHTFTYSNSALASPYQANNARGLRNLPRDQLGGVIFGCTDTTIKECLGRQLFGLPRQHISYVKNINPGLPVFLFNYNDKTIHGIFEAASSGQMHINPYAWTSDGSGKTPYPAQVQIRVRLHCEPLPENKFKPIILDNYYTQHHFCFELDLAQSSKLISQLSSLAYAPSGVPYNPAFLRSITRGSPENDKIAENGSFEPQDWENKSSGGYCQDALDEKEFIYMKLKQLALERERSGPPTNGHAEKSTNARMSNNNDVRIDQATFLKPQDWENKSSGGYCQDALDEKEFIYMKLKQLALERERSGPPTNGHAEKSTNARMSNNNDVRIDQATFLKPQDRKNKSSGGYCQDALDEKEFIYMKIKQLALEREHSGPPTNGHAEKSTNARMSNNNDVRIDQATFLKPQDRENKSSGGYCQDALDEKEFIYMKLKQLALERERSGPPTNGHAEKSTNAGMSNNNDVRIDQATFLKPQNLENKSSGSYCQDALNEKEIIYMKLKQLALERERSGPPTNGHAEESTNAGISNNNDVSIGQEAFLEPQDLENKSSGSYCQDALDEKELIYMKLKQLALAREGSKPPTNGSAEESTNAGISNNNDVSIGQEAFLEPQPPGEEKNEEGAYDSADDPSFITQLLMKELKAFREEQTSKISGMEKKLANTEEEIKLLKSRCSMLESTNPSRTHDGENVIELDDIVNNESIILAGGYDGDSWLSALDSYSPSNDVLKSLKPMSSVRSCFAIANLSGELYVFGGLSESMWYDTVESYNLADNKWTAHPRLNKRNGNLSGATLKDKIFAIGGGNGIVSFSEVEMYDPQVGRWIPSRSMWQKRFALAAAELNGALYAVGGYDGVNYLATAERFDPREHAWTKIESMSTKRGSHVLVPLREKLYAVGGYNGSRTVPSIEIYDPRRGSWMIGEPMNYSRGYPAAAVLNESIYVIGGQSNNELVDVIERYKEGQGWQTINSRVVGKRVLSSAIVLEED